MAGGASVDGIDGHDDIGDSALAWVRGTDVDVAEFDKVHRRQRTMAR
jgi:hypothetical protein